MKLWQCIDLCNGRRESHIYFIVVSKSHVAPVSSYNLETDVGCNKQLLCMLYV